MTNEKPENDEQVKTELLVAKRNRYFFWLILSPLIAMQIVSTMYVLPAIFETGFYFKHQAFFDWMMQGTRFEFVMLTFVSALTAWVFVASSLADRKFPKTKNLSGYYNY